MFALTEAAPELGQQHLTHQGFVADQLYQLINAVLFQQLFSALLLECQPGIQKFQRGSFAASGLCIPRQPALSLHGAEQRAHVSA